MIEIGADGCVDVEAELVPVFLAHGFMSLSADSAGHGPLPEQQCEAPVQELAATEEDIDALNRRELFAFLRARGLSGSRNATNDELRAIAWQSVNETRKGS